MGDIMNYYLVALIDENSYIKIQSLQKQLSDEYDLYDKLPMLHMTLEVIEDAELEKLIPSLHNIFKDTKKMKIKIKNGICFEPPFKSVNLKVENDENIKEFVYDVNHCLKSYNFKVRENVDDWDLHISLANTVFSKKEWLKNEFESACKYIMNLSYDIVPEITEIQLWKPINDDDEMVLFKQKLK
ncbi:AKAP7 2'5' RNA ligase-like domain-containing protein [Clostridium grantii DSM 8605]|uniref:AKAP7 2'5' RNA ligase-like domain-containing protein n=2 Tax=Clostridium TaxID=1485 RepID=A0A1M5SBY3_9CLOT|nr:AKAP7 2'5' RNA ligase-like domain-containing protein [Clostridium grantii DSM 8605]